MTRKRTGTGPFPNWLKAAREAHNSATGQDLTQEELAALAGVTQSAVQKWEAGTRKLPPHKATLLARHLGVSPEYLMFGRKGDLTIVKSSNEGKLPNVDSPIPLRNGARVVGTVGAGGWQEVDEGNSRIKTLPQIPGRDEDREQFAFLVIGNSMDQAGIVDGSYVVCVYEDVIRNGEPVVIERRRGQLFQRSVKEYRANETHIELIPRSSDPSYQTIRLDKRTMKEDDDTVIVIVGRVIATLNYL